MKKGVFVMLALILLGSPAFTGGQKDKAAGSDLILMHDKGGNPNYQPFTKRLENRQRQL